MTQWIGDPTDSFSSTATDLSTRRAFASPPPTAAGPSSAPAPALDTAAQQVVLMSILILLRHIHHSWPASSLSYRKFIECRDIGLFRISNSISYRTSHIVYLDILKTNEFFVFFRRKFQKFAENSENSPKIRRKFWKFAENSENSPKIRRKFWKFAKNSSKRRSSLRPSYRIVSYRIEKKTLISYRYRIESKKSLSLLSGAQVLRGGCGQCSTRCQGCIFFRLLVY